MLRLVQWGMAEDGFLSRDMVTPIPKGELRPWRCPKGDEACTRKEPCASCRGRRSRTSGRRKQNQGKKLVGVPSSKFSPTDANEENWKDTVLRWEVKSGAQVKAIATKFLLVEGQSNASRAIGDSRPVALLAMPPQWGNEGLVVIRASSLRQILDLARQAEQGPARSSRE